VPQMQGVGCADVLFVLQVPDNKADAVRCERLLKIYLYRENKRKSIFLDHYQIQ